ncbi:MAG: hypothetical protein ACD_39C00144G0001 [uncultured bacterium]|nr:MAG: hypothetical protein ACD_39C00144G0001 [uncultured bacterium]
MQALYFLRNQSGFLRSLAESCFYAARQGHKQGAGTCRPGIVRDQIRESHFCKPFTKAVVIAESLDCRTPFIGSVRLYQQGIVLMSEDFFERWQA